MAVPIEDWVSGWISSGELENLGMSVWQGGRPVFEKVWGRGQIIAIDMPLDVGSMFHGYSCGKPWVTLMLAQELAARGLCWETPLADVLPWVHGSALEPLTLHALAVHEAGIPNAPLPTSDAGGARTREARMRSWVPRYPMNTRYEYHAESGWWLLASVLEAFSSQSFRRVSEAFFDRLGLGTAAGYALREDWASRRVLPKHVGAHTGRTGRSDAYLQAYDDRLLALAASPLTEIGVPGSGWISTVSGLSRLYQEVLAALDGSSPRLSTEAVASLFAVDASERIDAMTGAPAYRLRGFVGAGDETRHLRGFPPGCSSSAFGHMGAGGQFAWADPATGVSCVILSASLERDPFRAGLRGLQLGTAALALAG